LGKPHDSALTSRKPKFTQLAVMGQIYKTFWRVSAAVKALPCQYLGLPLHLKKLRRVDYVPLLDKVGGKLPGWKGKLMNKAARAQLFKTVLTSIVTYHATVFPLPKWLIKKINKLIRSFLWKGEEGEDNKGGVCLVNWEQYVGQKI
jgi:hypothetical protein